MRLKESAALAAGAVTLVFVVWLITGNPMIALAAIVGVMLVATVAAMLLRRRPS